MSEEINPGEDYQERIDVVDEDDNVMRTVSRREMREQNLRRRTVHLLIMNSRDEMLMQKRSKNKHVRGGWYEPGASGCVTSGDTYDETARKEIEEELGIEDPDITFLYKMQYADEVTVFNTQVYLIRYDGEITIQPEEVEKIEWVPVGGLEQFIDDHKVCPDGVLMLNKFMEEHYTPNE